jgi:ribosomal-protein-alanine N-acetyltransferase
MKTPTFETQRLVLRPFAQADAAELHRILNQDDVLKYFPGPGSPSLEKVERFVEKQMRQWDEVGYAWWAVELKSSRALIGWNGLQFLPETRETEIGFLIDRTYWGQGLSTEAGRIGVRFAFESVGVEELIALAHPGNLASQRVIVKLGLRFVEETEYFEMPVRKFALRAEEFERPTASP